MSCGVGCRHSLDPAFLCLWCRPAAVPLIRSLAWELPYAMGVALESKKKRYQNALSFAKIGLQLKIKTIPPSPGPFSFSFFFFLFFFLLFRVEITAHGSLQANGQIRAAAASLHHSHSNAGSELCLQHIPQLTGNAGSLPH